VVSCRSHYFDLLTFGNKYLKSHVINFHLTGLVVLNESKGESFYTIFLWNNYFNVRNVHVQKCSRISRMGRNGQIREIKYREKKLFESFAKINSHEKTDILGNSSKFHKVKKICPYEILLYTRFFRKQLLWSLCPLSFCPKDLDHPR